ncbi:ABC transporter ATP-binding protein [Gorillibacterium timonense]|uniref:ABC transporter ATP-binding protein n=1 Tax=Gorillibacterium timonense TaxID=1689269 RepID=UPI00071D6FEB|nr:ABC transporter ATP-binding protein [Gorillibacterium timonense]
MLKLFRNLKPYTTPIAIVLILVLMQSLAELYLPTLMSDIVDKGIVHNDNPYIWRIGGFMLLIAFVSMICAVVSNYLSAKVGVGFGRDLRNKVFAHVENYSLREFDKIGTASLITRTTNDITQIQNITIMIMRMMISAPMMCIGGIIMALNKDTTLSWVIVVVIPILALAIYAIAGSAMPYFKAMQKKIDKINLVVREELTGIRVIRAFNRTEHEKKRFTEANADLTDTAIKVNKIMAFMMPIMMIVMNLTTIAIIWFGGIRIDEGNMQVGSLMAFLQYVMQIMFSLIMVSMMFVMLPRASASAVRINEVLDTVSDINDPATNAPEHKHGYVEFDNVTFSFPGAEQPAVRGITFSAGPGETTAIIGGTGSGKSTIINLIPRFYDVQSGSVRVNGVDVREISQEFLRSKVGYVPQKAVLFTGTISENIRYGKEDATDEEVRHAAEVAQATDFIGEMKEGYDSVISQGGTNVSGGQKQRLSIARALVRKPEIYIFDDSFSALDFKTDAKLRQALKGETADATVLIVAQRVSTVMDADRIIVLDEGEVAGIGTHKELMSTCEVYREIVSSQLSEEEIA